MKSLPITKIILVLLLSCEELLKSAPKIITFLAYLFGCETLSLESNPIPYPGYLDLSLLTFFVDLTAPNRQLCKVILIT